MPGDNYSLPVTAEKQTACDNNKHDDNDDDVENDNNSD